MYKDILNNKQIRLLGLIRQFKNNFYLSGETAIALQIGHRRSIDFDLFTEESFDILKLVRVIKKAGYIVEATLEESPEELTIVVDSVKITFLEYPFRIEHPVDFDSIITMPDLLTLSSMKAYSLGKRSKPRTTPLQTWLWGRTLWENRSHSSPSLQTGLSVVRGKWKDYVDLYFIVKDYFSIKDISRRAKELFGGGFNERLFREQLCYFEDIDFSETIDFADEPISDMRIKYNTPQKLDSGI
jgi:hypothetical protein